MELVRWNGHEWEASCLVRSNEKLFDCLVTDNLGKHCEAESSSYILNSANYLISSLFIKFYITYLFLSFYALFAITYHIVALFISACLRHVRGTVSNYLAEFLASFIYYETVFKSD
jgi:hypothetical protein